MDFVRKLPWWLKILLKICLSMLPLSHSFWRRLGFFRHGYTDAPDKAIKTFGKFFEKANEFSSLKSQFVSLELGPGDSVLTAFAARARGAKAAWLVDSGDFALRDLESIKVFCQGFSDRRDQSLDQSSAVDFHRFLRDNGVYYLTNGLNSLHQISKNSIDFCWSQVVLEHILKDDFLPLMKRMRDLCKENSISLHSIDFRDHLSGGLQNLRFSEKVWESRLIQTSGFYTNRLRPSQMLKLFDEAGFDTQIIFEDRWDIIPISRNKMAEIFRNLPTDDFLISGWEVILRPKPICKET